MPALRKPHSKPNSQELRKGILHISSDNFSKTYVDTGLYLWLENVFCKQGGTASSQKLERIGDRLNLGKALT